MIVQVTVQNGVFLARLICRGRVVKLCAIGRTTKRIALSIQVVANLAISHIIFVVVILHTNSAP